MPAKTRYELIQINAKLATDNSSLRARIAQLEVDIEIARAAKSARSPMLVQQACLFMDIAEPIEVRRPS